MSEDRKMIGEAGPYVLHAEVIQPPNRLGDHCILTAWRPDKPFPLERDEAVMLRTFVPYPPDRDYRRGRIVENGATFERLERAARAAIAVLTEESK